MAFTSTAEIQRLLGEDGYAACLEDLTTSNVSAFLDDVIDFATDVIASHTQEHYLSADIDNISQVRMNATVIACHFMSERRGNASLFEGRMETIKEWLTDLREGRIHLPGVTAIAPDTPAIRNNNVNFNTRQRMIVDKEISTGDYPDEPTYPYDMFHY